MTRTQHFGVILLVAGTLTVIGVILASLLFPLTKAPPDNLAIASESFLPISDADALVPYYPSAPPIPIEIPIAKLPPNQRAEAGQQRASASKEADSTEENTNPDTKADALQGDNDSRLKRSFRLAIPSLDIDAPVEPVNLTELHDAGGKPFRQWSVPNKYAAGWHNSSAPPGQSGNTVINGHNNIHGAIFRDLVDLALGEKIVIYEEDKEHVYQVVHREFLLERGESLRSRLRNARWILPSEDARLTIVTCWPNTTNSHRLVIIARPLPSEPDL